MGEGTPGFWVDVVHGGKEVLVHEAARVWTLGAVSTAAGISDQRVGELLGGGRFKNAFKLGRVWLIPEEDVARYLACPDLRRKGGRRWP